MRLEELTESPKDEYTLYHDSLTGAVQEVDRFLERRGYQMDDEDAFNQIGVGPAKPQPGDTNKYSVRITKDGEEVRQQVHFQVYNRGIDRGTYELNVYVS